MNAMSNVGPVARPSTTPVQQNLKMEKFKPIEQPQTLSNHNVDNKNTITVEKKYLLLFKKL